MHCPRCQTALLDETDQHGILVQCCPSCRGGWLQSLELEKLLRRAASEPDHDDELYDVTPGRRRLDDGYDPYTDYGHRRRWIRLLPPGWRDD